MKNLDKVAKETQMLTGMNGRMQINYDGETVWSDYFPDVNSWEEYHDGSVHFFTNRPMTEEEIEERLIEAVSDKNYEKKEIDRMLSIENKLHGVR